MFSPKYLFLGISGIGVTGASLMTWWLTKNSKNSIDPEIQRACGDFLDDWYKDGDENHPLFYLNNGDTLTEDKYSDYAQFVTNNQMDTTRGYYKKNNKDNDAGNYRGCKSEVEHKNKNSS